MTTTTSTGPISNLFKADQTEILARLAHLSSQAQSLGINALPAMQQEECKKLAEHVGMVVAPIGRHFKGMTIQSAETVYRHFIELDKEKRASGLGLGTVHALTGMQDITLVAFESKAAQRYLSIHR